MFKNGMRPVHPGEVLREDYLIPLGLTASALARALNVPAARVNEIMRERRGITADTAIRLAHYFGGDARSWMNLQAAYDLRVAEIHDAKRIKREISPVKHTRTGDLDSKYRLIILAAKRGKQLQVGVGQSNDVDSPKRRNTTVTVKQRHKKVTVEK